MSQVEVYKSDEDEDQEVGNVVNKDPRKTFERLWVKERKFISKHEADEVINGEDCWGYGASSESLEGKKIYYRCNKVKARGVQCEAKIYLLHDSSSTGFTLYRASNCHTHDNIITKANTGISEEVKKKIKELWVLKLKPKKILEQIALLNLPQPTIRQLNNYIAKLNKQKFGPSTISLGEVESWCSANIEVPDDEDTPFVAGFKIVEDDDEIENNLFRFFVTTKRLLQTTLISDKLHADATYKVIWQGYPVIVCGTTDMGRHFHHFGVSVCVNERQEDFAFVFNTLKDTVHKIFNKNLDFEILISDAAGKIKNVFFLNYNSHCFVSFYREH